MPDHFDIFLSHNSSDKPAVIALAKRLKAQGLKVWLDVWELRPGQCWLPELEKAIESINSVAILVGKDGFGPWHDIEMCACFEEFARRKSVVLPVLLPNCPEKPVLPLLLRSFTWVDLRDGKESEGFHRLMWGITGKKPKELDEDDFLIGPGRQGSVSKQKKVFVRKPRPLKTHKTKSEEASANQFGNPTVIQLPPTVATPKYSETSNSLRKHD